MLPFQLSGPVYIVQEIGNVLPKLYVFLRGPTGFEVLLKARNSFLGGRRIINTFEAVPDVPQAYFELNINGGTSGILNNFDDLCSAKNSTASSTPRSPSTAARRSSEAASRDPAAARSRTCAPRRSRARP